MKTNLLAMSLLLLTGLVIFSYTTIQNSDTSAPPLPLQSILLQPDPVQPVPVQPDPVHQAKGPGIELVFALDTTGSMDGLIGAAKEKIWSIASSMINTSPAPQIKIGLVAYRDKGDDYITRIIPLSDDLDKVYAQLLALEAAGGGDTPESVNSALDDAINRINWSHSQSDFKAIFLIGDAPGHLEYPEETPFQVSLKQAKEKGIIVNTIQAGADPITHHQWQTIAALGGGAKFQVNQQGNSVAITTPFDETIAKASRELDATHLYFGDSTTQKQAQILLQQREKVYRESSSAALARRAKYKATTGHKNKLDETHDLVTEISGKRISLSAIPAESLPPEIQTMTANEQQAFIQQKASLRAQIELRLSQLTQQRDSYIAAQLKGQVDLDKSLDHQLLSTLQTQAQTKGFDYRHTNLDY